jgi:hypothetical protein
MFLDDNSGDTIDMNLALKGGKLIDCPLIGAPTSQGSLSVLEIGPSTALNQFEGVVDQLIGGDGAPDADKKWNPKDAPGLGGSLRYASRRYRRSRGAFEDHQFGEEGYL